jgi:hypothetical protein
MWKGVVEQGRPQMTISRMRIECWVPKATNTHTLRFCNTYCFYTAKMVCTNAHQRHVIRTLPALFLLITRLIFLMLNQTSLHVSPNVWRLSASCCSHCRWPVTAVGSISLSMWQLQVFYFFLWLQRSFKGRFNAIHLINTPPYVNSITDLVRSLLKPKLAARVSITLRQI